MGAVGPQSMADAAISVRPSSVGRTLGAGVLLLGVAHTTGQFFKLQLGHDTVKGLVPLFDMDLETNAPAFFSALLLMSAGMVLAVIAVVHARRMARHATKWKVLAAGFVYLSLDEALLLHEQSIIPLRAVLARTSLVSTVGGEVVYGVFYYSWVVAGLAIVLALALYFNGFLRDLPATARGRFLLAAALYLGGSLGVEVIAGRHVEQYGRDNWTYAGLVLIEETLEMLGVVVFIWALLKYCAETCREVRFVVADGAAGAATPRR